MRQQLVIVAFLYSHSTLVKEMVDDMLESTKREKLSGKTKRGSSAKETNHPQIMAMAE